MDNENITVECSVCKQHLINHVGSTPCCGALAYLVEYGKVTNDAILFSVDKDRVKPVKLNISKNERTD
jgi:hypothetical protein